MSWRVNERKYSLTEVAEILGINRRAVCRLTNKGEIGYYQVGKRLRVVGQRHLDEYRSWLKKTAKRN